MLFVAWNKISVLIHTAQVKEGHNNVRVNFCWPSLPFGKIFVWRVEMIDLEEPMQCCRAALYAEDLEEDARIGRFRDMTDSWCRTVRTA